MLEFYFRFRFWPIGVSFFHPPPKFRSNPTIGGRVMRSYRFFKMATIESEIYFHVQVSWRHSSKKMDICWHTKFPWDILIHCWDKTNPDFGKQTAAILEFYFFCFDFDLIIVIGIMACHFHSTIHQRTYLGGVMSKWMQEHLRTSNETMEFAAQDDFALACRILS